MNRVGMFRGKALIEDREDPLSSEGDARTRLLAIRTIVLRMLDDQAVCYKGLLPQLASHGVVLAAWEELSLAGRRGKRVFRQPRLTGAHPGSPAIRIASASARSSG